jgi:hypothetical protein
MSGKNDRTALQAIAIRVIDQTRRITQDYTARGKQHWTEATWPGNTTHELPGSVDPRKAATAVGRRLLANTMQ